MCINSFCALLTNQHVQYAHTNVHSLDGINTASNQGLKNLSCKRENNSTDSICLNNKALTEL